MNWLKENWLRMVPLLLGVIFSTYAFYTNWEGGSVWFGLIGVVLILFGLLVATKSSLLGFGDNMQSINGIGTMLYGKSNIDQNNNSYVSTKWIVFIGLPIIPLNSYIVTNKGTSTTFLGTSASYKMLKTSLNIKQIAKTYATAYGLVIFIITLLMYAYYI